MIGAFLNDRYRLDAEIGRGGMGVVYRARDTLLERDVAVKVLSTSTLGTEGRARLLREAQAAAQLNHPNVVSVHDAGEADGMPFIVMEWVEGESLRNHVPKTLDETLSIARQVCAALAHAHAHGIIHRDLKPGNVMVTRTGLPSPTGHTPCGTGEGPGVRAKLADFGLARTGASRLTAEGAIVGTVFYLAPEQALGETIDGRADLYALGVMLYELTTGQLPFTGDDPLAVIAQHLHAPVVPPSTHNSEIPPALDTLIVRLLSKRPDDRPASAAAVRQTLEQLLRPEVPPETSKASPKAERRRHNLPVQATPFIGRETQLAEVRELLARPEVRLLTLTGPGGTGKTRLALQVAAEVLDAFPDGVYFVALALIRDPALVLSTIAMTLGVRESGGRPIVESLAFSLQDRQVLLVLDNLEQVAEAAPEVTGLLAAALRLKVLVTSRVSLHVYGEHEYRVPSMIAPGPEDFALSGVEGPPFERLARVEAVRLFVQRAQAARADFTLSEENALTIASICARLDGLPLAIELAAARVRLLSPRAMLPHLDDRLGFLTGRSRDLPARQRTLRATIDWSYDLLDENERTLFRRLAVFVGGCTVQAAQAIACAPPQPAIYNLKPSTFNLKPETVVLDLLESLLDQNLLQTSTDDDEPRFAMLETVREYALERLAASEATEAETVRRHHATFFLALAEEAEVELYGSEQVAWLDRLETEHDNLRAALAWSMEDDIEGGLRLAGALGEFWLRHGYVSEGRDWLTTALAASADHGPGLDLLRAKALHKAGVLACIVWDVTAATPLLEESVTLYRALGDGRGLAHALSALADAARQGGELAKARSLSEESIALFRQLDDRPGLAWALYQRGYCACHHEHDYESARACAVESLHLGQETGNLAVVGRATSVLGIAAFVQGDYAAAQSFYEKSLALCQNKKDRPGAGQALGKLGDVAYVQGHYERARAYYEQFLEIWRELGSRISVSTGRRRLGLTSLRQGRLEEAQAHMVEALARDWEIEFPQGIAAGVAEWAGLAERRGQPERAARLLGAAEAILEANKLLLPSLSHVEYERNVAAVRAQLDETSRAAAWAEGRAMAAEGWERVVAYTLGEDGGERIDQVFERGKGR